jgi:hypothetical protein
MDKLTIINRALSATGNAKLTIANDGSDEGDASESAFGRAIDYLMAMYEWPFTTQTGNILRSSAP